MNRQRKKAWRQSWFIFTNDWLYIWYPFHLVLKSCYKKWKVHGLFIGFSGLCSFYSLYFFFGLLLLSKQHDSWKHFGHLNVPFHTQKSLSNDVQNIYIHNFSFSNSKKCFYIVSTFMLLFSFWFYKKNPRKSQVRR